LQNAPVIDVRIEVRQRAAVFDFELRAFCRGDAPLTAIARCRPAGGDRPPVDACFRDGQRLVQLETEITIGYERS
jgi:hypothetical protein